MHDRDTDSNGEFGDNTDEIERQGDISGAVAEQDLH